MSLTATSLMGTSRVILQETVNVKFNYVIATQLISPFNVFIFRLSEHQHFQDFTCQHITSTKNKPEFNVPELCVLLMLSSVISVKRGTFSLSVVLLCLSRIIPNSIRSSNCYRDWLHDLYSWLPIFTKDNVSPGRRSPLDSETVRYE